MGLFGDDCILMQNICMTFKCYGSEKLMKEFPTSGGRRPLVLIHETFEITTKATYD